MKMGRSDYVRSPHYSLSYISVLMTFSIKQLQAPLLPLHHQVQKPSC